MNWKLILNLSMFGLVMGIATVFVIPSNFEPLCWLAIFTISAAIISSRCSKLFFVHGLLVSIANSVWVTSAHVLWFGSYSAGHAAEIAAMTTYLPLAGSPRLQMVLLFPAVGIASGLVLGLFAYAAHLLRLNFTKESLKRSTRAKASNPGRGRS